MPNLDRSAFEALVLAELNGGGIDLCAGFDMARGSEFKVSKPTIDPMAAFAHRTL